MKASFFTPTHNAAYLLDVWRSILQQDVADFEWIIVPNAAIGQPQPTIPEEIRADPRVVIKPYQYVGDLHIGDVKKFCCKQAYGDVFIEMDHDDVLAPGCLKAVLEAAAAGGEFIYSDTANFIHDDKRTPFVYSLEYGWESYPVTFDGVNYTAMKTFDADARSLCEITCAPDHVRCWTRALYERVGGHDPKLMVGDDHDLMIRCYLDGAKFTHLQQCGYLYRRHATNTIGRLNYEIQVQVAKNRAKYLHRLIDAWLTRTGKRYVDLSDDSPRTPIQLSLDDNSVGCLKLYDDYLSQLKPVGVIEFMNEAYRVLEPGGWLCVAAPSTTGQTAFSPDYHSYWNEHVFNYYTRREYAARLSNYHGRFQLVQTAVGNMTNQSKPGRVGQYVYADMVALKGQRCPGAKYI